MHCRYKGGGVQFFCDVLMDDKPQPKDEQAMPQEPGIAGPEPAMAGTGAAEPAPEPVEPETTASIRQLCNVARDSGLLYLRDHARVRRRRRVATALPASQPSIDVRVSRPPGWHWWTQAVVHGGGTGQLCAGRVQGVRAAWGTTPIATSVVLLLSPADPALCGMGAQGMGGLRPNTVVVGYKSRWMTQPVEEVDQYERLLNDVVVRVLTDVPLLGSTAIAYL